MSNKYKTDKEAIIYIVIAIGIVIALVRGFNGQQEKIANDLYNDKGAREEFDINDREDAESVAEDILSSDYDSR